MFTIQENVDEYVEALTGKYERYLKSIHEALGWNANVTAGNLTDCLNLGDQDVPTTVTVEKSQTDDELVCEIIAHGPCVVFSEFGAGRDTGRRSDVELIRNMHTLGVDVYPGSWSSTQGTREYATKGSWKHGDRLYNTIKPANAITAEVQAYRTCGFKYVDGVRLWSQ